MKLKQLHIAMFRNLEQVDLQPGDRFNIIHGNNAQGKTNILEAIYLLGTMKSFRHARNAELVSWGAPAGVISGLVERDGVAREIALLLDRDGKRARIDRKAVVRLTEFFGNLNVVVFSPEELTMLRGMPEMRRRYLDRAIFSSDNGYLALHHEYTKILKQRNSLLKTGDRIGLDVWNEQLAVAGANVIARRMAFVKRLSPYLATFYGDIAGNGEKAGLSYRPHLMTDKEIREDYAGNFLAVLAKTADQERRFATTMVGAHRDDLVFTIDGKIVRQYASQGQQRSYVLALKMAEIEYMQEIFANPPVLLLDDISSELDRERNRNLMEFLKHKEMQVFISTTALESLALHGIDNYRAFRVQCGQVLNQG